MVLSLIESTPYGVNVVGCKRMFVRKEYKCGIESWYILYLVSNMDVTFARRNLENMKKLALVCMISLFSMVVKLKSIAQLWPKVPPNIFEGLNFGYNLLTPNVKWHKWYTQVLYALGVGLLALWLKRKRKRKQMVHTSGEALSTTPEDRDDHNPISWQRLHSPKYKFNRLGKLWATSLPLSSCTILQFH